MKTLDSTRSPVSTTGKIFLVSTHHITRVTSFMVAMWRHSKNLTRGAPSFPILDRTPPRNNEKTTIPRMFIPDAFVTLSVSTTILVTGKKEEQRCISLRERKGGRESEREREREREYRREGEANWWHVCGRTCFMRIKTGDACVWKY